jgi:hypothetical protein
MTTVTTTDTRRRRSRWPAQRIRAIAWVTGAATFLGSVAALAASPPPAAPTRSEGADAAEGVVVQRRVIRRIVIVDTGAPVANGPVSVVQPPSAPAPPAITSTGGS